ncbi:lipocalin/fatty-acid binding family protein [Streptomyces sp. NPDC054901]
MGGSITGKFEMTSTDNYDAYLKAVRIGLIQRQMAMKAKPTLDITENGGRWSVKTLTALNNAEIEFVPGETVTEKTVEGLTCPSVITLDGGRFIQKLHLDGSVATVTRTFTDDAMHEVSEAAGVTANRTFKRL